MKDFGDIIHVEDRRVFEALREIDYCLLALALKTATPELREKFFRNMSQRVTAIIHEEQEYMGPVRLADVERAQHTVAAVVFLHESEADDDANAPA